jgi:hypothetical protein
MKRQEFLMLRHLPKRLTAEEAAWLLGFAQEHIPLLVGAGLLAVLGDPPKNGDKFFHLPEILEFAEDRRKMARACDVLVNTWKARNRKAREKAALANSNKH